MVTPPTTLWIGDRIARIRDPWDNLWWVHTRVAAPSEEELEAGPPDEEAREAIQMVGDTLDAEMRRRGAAAADG